MFDPIQTVERMRACLCLWEPASDARAVFLGCYALMTDNMMAALAAEEFHDPVWVRRLLVHFADYYFTALDAYDAGEAAVPAVWRCAYDAAARADLSVIQQLLLGVNAHINYDLVFAAADLLDDEWATLSLAARQQRQADYNHVNAVISRTIDSVQDTILERLDPRLNVIDIAFGRVDEWLVSLEIKRWRDRVWAEAVRRVELADPAARERQRQAVERSALDWAQRLGGWSARGRARESH